MAPKYVCTSISCVSREGNCDALLACLLDTGLIGLDFAFDFFSTGSFDVSNKEIWSIDIKRDECFWVQLEQFWLQLSSMLLQGPLEGCSVCCIILLSLK